MIKKYALLIFIILLKFIIQLQLVHPVYDLQRDEYLHLDQARHLAAGYISVPPLNSWVAWLILKLGGGEFWIRFFPALFGALTIFIVWKAIEALKGNLFALLLGSACVLFSALLRLNILFQPNSFDILAWTFFYYCIIRYTNGEQKKWLWFAAIGFAIGFLNKYNIIFQLIGLLPALVLTQQRSVFTKKALYGAIILAFLLMAPNLWWQYKNGFPVFAHMRELTNTQLVYVSRGDFLKEQLLFFAGGLIVLLAGFISLFLYAPFRKYIVLFYGFAFTMLLFIFLRAKAYYAIGIYPIFFAFGAVWLETLLQNGWKKWVLRPLLLLLPLAFFALMLKVAFPLLPPEEIVAKANLQQKTGLHRWEDGKEHPISQDFADMLGWKELAAIVDSAYEKVNDPANTIVFCDNYGEAGAVNYYSKHKNINALSVNADYATWFPENKKWQHCIRVKENADVSKEIKYFDSVAIAGRIKEPYAREIGTTVYIMLNANDSIRAILQREITKAKNKYRQSN
ncbi:MAG: glycosyltransferase family 39 protein [Ferruginibacter sp.]